MILVHTRSLLALAAVFLVLVLPITAQGQNVDKAAVLSVSPNSLDFLNSPLGIATNQKVTVSNTGSSDGFLDVALGAEGDCGPFTLTQLSGPVTVPAFGSVDIIVTFEPMDTAEYVCHLELGAGLPDVPIRANAWDPILAWSIEPDELLFGFVPLNVPSTLQLVINNTGGLPFTISPSIAGGCPDFAITSGGEPVEVLFGYPRTIEVTFTPTILGGQICELDLGATLPPVPLNAIGREPQYGWEIAPDSLDFGYVATDSASPLEIVVRNTGEQPLPVEPSVAGGCAAFVPISGPVQVARGDSTVVVVEFRPFSTTSFSCDLDLGPVLPPVPMTGIGRLPGLDWIAPTFLDFGTRGVGQSTRRYITITNTGTIPFDLDVVLPDTCQSWILVDGGGHFTLPPGSFGHGIVVDFHPVVEGLHSIALSLGSTLPPIQLQGEAFPRAEQVIVTPNPLTFGWRFLGSDYVETLTINNAGGTFIDIDVALADTSQGFTILSGAGAFVLPPGYVHEVDVRFRPLAAGSFATQLELGASQPAVLVSGSAEGADNIISVSPDSLVFGPLEIGQQQTLAVAITNNSHQLQTVYPKITAPEFNPLQSSLAIAGGLTATVNVTFQPSDLGTSLGTLDLQHDAAPDVPLVGRSKLTGQPGQNRVGVFFDDGYASNLTHTFQPNQVVQGYLVLVDPSETSGVSAWELAYDHTGDAYWLGWQLEGLNINVGTYRELIVGIGGDPLPFGPTVLLGTFQMLVSQPYPEPVTILLEPTRFPSLPGQMVWAPGSDSSMLMAMVPYTGDTVVAGINVSNPSDAGVPVAPALTRLLPNVPNPFNPSTEIRFELAKPQHARVAVYDVTGKLVKILADESLAAGPQTRLWQGRDSGGRTVPSGVYYVRLETGERSETRKIMLLK